MSTTPKKARGKPFTGKDDPRRHDGGTKSSATIAFNREIRAIICSVGNEAVESKGQKLSRIEGAVRGMYQAATKGNVQAFTALVERVEGKVAQGVEVGAPGGGPVEVILREIVNQNHAND